MALACGLAEKSVSEPGKVRPFVGAVAATPAGDVLVQASRGEEEGAHAEFLLMRKAERLGIPLRGAVLFTTLEPCTLRSSGKVPCAERVAWQNFSIVYIGTLDPNPQITGQGEMYLTMQRAIEVRRFAPDFAARLRVLNHDFFEAYAHHYSPASDLSGRTGESVYTHGDVITKFAVARIAGDDDRNKLLQQTASLASGASQSILIAGGDLSWLRELYIPLLEAALRNVSIRILASHVNPDVTSAVASLGAELRKNETPPPLRATLTDHGTGDFAAIVRDVGSSSLLTSPEDGAMLDMLAERLETLWETARVVHARSPITLTPIALADVIEQLRATVPAYRDADLRLECLAPDEAVPLTSVLESFKLFRLRRLELVRLHQPRLFPAGRVGQSPWIIAPPVIEDRAEGRVVIDGTHRFALAHERQHTVKALVVRNCIAPLPAQPTLQWDEMRIVRTKLPRSQRYVGYDDTAFRNLRAAFETVDRV